MSFLNYFGLVRRMKSAGKKRACYVTEAERSAKRSESRSKSLSGTEVLLATLSNAIDGFMLLTGGCCAVAYGSGGGP